MAGKIRCLTIGLFFNRLARKIIQLLAIFVSLALFPAATSTASFLVETLAESLVFRAVVTAYSSSLDETDGDPFITASGETVRKGIVACSRDYPFGTKFLINGQVYECLDRLAPQYDERIDIWMPSKVEAIEYGKRKLWVEVVAEEGSGSNG